ncbi:MAG: hypothetical protein IKN64_00505 [Desulfovibrio sp.]|nr:hypothetical protein [Desulfovibrio sp.]
MITGLDKGRKIRKIAEKKRISRRITESIAARSVRRWYARQQKHQTKHEIASSKGQRQTSQAALHMDFWPKKPDDALKAGQNAHPIPYDQ